MWTAGLGNLWSRQSNSCLLRCASGQRVVMNPSDLVEPTDGEGGRNDHQPVESRSVKVRLSRAAVVLVVFVLAVVGCSSSTKHTKEAAPRPSAYAVGMLTTTFVDRSRSTPAHGTHPALSSRTLLTTIWYPAAGDAKAKEPVSGAAADRSDGPYPLIVFAHGLGGSPQSYAGFLSRWAAAGYVVAAPVFPLTHTNTAGGVVPDDVFDQPADMSYVITSVLDSAAQHSGPLAGLISTKEIAVAGHSEGAITTLGFFNTCCRDPRVKAAEILSGDPETYPNGRYDYSGNPPMLIVHGTADVLLPYEQMVGVFNSAKGPKALLALQGAGHANWFVPSSKWFTTAVKTTTDFFASYLRDDKTALSRLPKDGLQGVGTVHLAATPGSTTTIPIPPQPKTNRQATVTPTKNLTDGQTVTVRWSGYLPGKVINVLQCSSESQTGCDIAAGRILTPDPTGSGTVTLKIKAGKVGSGVCDATHTSCQVVINDAGLQTPSASIRIPISFAAR
jgi:dienelactone hydrolase